ncbi:MAG: hypothetical protein JWM74_1741 [Myxococcaceae bacterium]|nr:hypothetical protein [Myxococcaceae bacterium]
MKPIEQLIADACLGARTGDELEHDLPGFVARYGLSPEQARALRADGRRLLAYRLLVRNNLAGVVFKMMARTRARAPIAFDRTFVQFLDEVGPKSHYLRDVPHELFAWARARWEADATLPPYLVDLAAYELAEYAVSAAEEPAPPVLIDVALDRAIAFAAHARFARYRFAVHTLPDDPADATVPEQRDVALVLYRDADEALASLELSPLHAAAIERLLAGDVLEAALRSAAAAQGVALDDAVLVSFAEVITELGERGVVLGGLTVTSPSG